MGVFGQLKLLGLEVLEECECGHVARDGNHVGDGFHHRPIDVGGFEERRVARFEARRDEGEARARGFEIIEEGVCMVGTANVDKRHGGFEDYGGGDGRVGGF